LNPKKFCESMTPNDKIHPFKQSIEIVGEDKRN